MVFFSLLTAMLIEVLNSFKVFRGYTSYIAVKILLFCDITYVYFLLQQGKFTGRIWRTGAPFNWNGTTVKLQAGRMWGITWRHLILALLSPLFTLFSISVHFWITVVLHSSSVQVFLMRLKEGHGQRSSWNWTSHSYLSSNHRGLVPAPTVLFSLLYKSATYGFLSCSLGVRRLYNHRVTIQRCVAATPAFLQLVPVVRKLDYAIHWTNHYPVDNASGFSTSYPLDSDLYDG